MTGPVATEALVEDGCRAVYGKNWDGPPDKAPGEAMRRVWRDLVAKAQAPLLAALQQVTAERDEADRRAGAAEREAERDREDARKRSAWLHQAKQQAGYSTNVSFDKVWAETLEKATRADAATSELARLRAEGEDTALVPLEPTVGMQEDGLAALEAAIRTHGKPSLPGFAAAHVYRAMVAARPSTAKEDQGDA